MVIQQYYRFLLPHPNPTRYLILRQAQDKLFTLQDFSSPFALYFLYSLTFFSLFSSSSLTSSFALSLPLSVSILIFTHLSLLTSPFAPSFPRLSNHLPPCASLRLCLSLSLSIFYNIPLNNVIISHF